MMNRCCVVGFVNGYRGVNDVRLDSLFINHRLYMLMDMVMNSFTGDNGSSLGRVSGTVGLSSISVFSSFSVECSPSVLLIAVVESLVLDRDEVVVVLFRKGLLVSDRLNSRMMVLLMNLLIQGSGHLLMLMRHNMLLSDVRLNIFVDSGSVLSIIGKEARNGLLCFLHCV